MKEDWLSCQKWQDNPSIADFPTCIFFPHQRPYQPENRSSADRIWPIRSAMSWRNCGKSQRTASSRPQGKPRHWRGFSRVCAWRGNGDPLPPTPCQRLPEADASPRGAKGSNSTMYPFISYVKANEIQLTYLLDPLVTH